MVLLVEFACVSFSKWCKNAAKLRSKAITLHVRNTWIYTILQIGDNSHVNNDDELLKALISEEIQRESFTAVVITGINQSHIPYLKNCHDEWTRQLK